MDQVTGIKGGRATTKVASAWRSPPFKAIGVRDSKDPGRPMLLRNLVLVVLDDGAEPAKV